MNDTHCWALREKLGPTQGGYAEGGITQIMGELKHGTIWQSGQQNGTGVQRPGDA
jgi:hypothetical protein